MEDPTIQVNLEDLLTYPLTPVPYSLATADGYFAKTDKAKAFHYVSKGIPDTVKPVGKTLTIYDGNAIFYLLKDIPLNFRLICKKIFSMLVDGDVFSTDSYDPESIKASERLRGGTTDKLIIKGANTRRPADWKTFLSNDQNKQQFIEIILREWSSDDYAGKLRDRQVIFICNGDAYLLMSEDGFTTKKIPISSLHSSQEETDTRR